MICSPIEPLTKRSKERRIREFGLYKVNWGLRVIYETPSGTMYKCKDGNMKEGLNNRERIIDRRVK